MRKTKPSDRANCNGPSLAGLTIGLPEGRELDLCTEVFERRGAEVLRCPLVLIRDTSDEQAVRTWLEQLISDKYDDVLLTTGEGLRRLWTFAGRFNMQVAVHQSLAATRRVVRGPKPIKALREIGLRADLKAATPTTEGLITTLTEQSMSGRRVGLQLYGQEPNLRLQRALRQMGAMTWPVWPYIYGTDSEDRQVVRLIEQLEAGRLNALAFTSATQVRRLWRVGRDYQLEQALHRGLERTCVAAVGPIVRDELIKRGVSVNVMPQDQFFIKPMVTALVKAIGR